MKKIVMFLLVMMMAACTFQTKHRGYVFPKTIDEDVMTIKTTSQLIDKIIVVH